MKPKARSSFPLALGLATVLVLWSARPAAWAAPRVVVSIKPVHSLLAGVMKGVGVPRLLVRGASSPHTYALKPSDVRALQGADLIFWVGREMETFLERPLKSISRKGRVVALSKIRGLKLRGIRGGGVWEAHEHAGTERRRDRKENEMHSPHQRDMHFWLDPRNAKAIVRAAARELGGIDPARKTKYETNGERVNKRLDALDDEIRTILRPVKAKPFIVFHDAFHYFEKRYGLNGAGAVSSSPEKRPGARRLVEIRRRILKTRSACVFSEPQFSPRLVEALVGGTPARIAFLDPLGASLRAGEGAYFDLMRDLAGSMRACLISPRRF